MSRIFSFVAVLILVWIVGSLLIAGRGLLIPFVMAVFIWHLLNTINMGVQGIPLLGRSLNLSPLVILFALGLWGSIWGVLGMFLSVPIMVMMMIIFAYFETTRPIAVLLSQNGHIYKAYETIHHKTKKM